VILGFRQVVVCRSSTVIIFLGFVNQVMVFLT